MEWSLHVGGAGACVKDHPKWHPGYFHPCLAIGLHRSLLRSISDQTPSPTCIEALFDESAFLQDNGHCTNHSSASSSPHLSRLSHSTCVSDSSSPSSDASASGDKLKKRRKYRKKRSVKRRNPTLSKNPQEGSTNQIESPSAAYCEEWIFSSASQMEENKRISFAGLTEMEQDVPQDLSVRRRSLETESVKSPKKSSSWLNIWQNLLKIAPLAKKKTREPIVVEINPAANRRPTLPSISEGVQSESQTPQSTPSLVFSSASGSVTACNIPYNPTNQEVCLNKRYVLSVLFLFIVPKL